MIQNMFIWICCIVVAFLTVCYINPILLMLAYKKNITDKPSGRKFQSRPIPVIGGWSVFAAIIFSLLVCNFFCPMCELFIPVAGLCIMFLLGLIDDLIELSYRTKFIFQIIVVSLWWYYGFRIDDFNGLFGLGEISLLASYIISLIAGVGLINAHNLLDGIDGLSSGFSICTCTVCGIYFFVHDDLLYACFAGIIVGALIPFFVCNVFSRKYKMFIGDSGALMLGALSYIFSCHIVHIEPMFDCDKYNFAMVMAIYALPVFDTVRVMVGRVCRRQSPFLPDRSHFHHLIVDFGFACYLTTAFMLTLSLMVFFGWLFTSKLGLDVTLQAVLTALFAFVLFWGVSFYIVRLKEKNPDLYKSKREKIIAISKRTRKIYKKIELRLDGRVRKKRVVH